jgi:hypothetical protein
VLRDHAPVDPYELHSWGPDAQNTLIADEHHWHDPVPELPEPLAPVSAVPTARPRPITPRDVPRRAAGGAGGR